MTKSHCFHLRAVWSPCEVSWWSALSFSCAKVQIMKSTAAFCSAVGQIGKKKQNQNQKTCYLKEMTKQLYLGLSTLQE